MTIEQDAAFQILSILNKIYSDKVQLSLPPDMEPYR